jgi:hypothetical protein
MVLMAGAANASTLTVYSSGASGAAPTTSLPFSFPNECFKSGGTDEIILVNGATGLKGKMYYKSSVPGSDTLTMSLSNAYWNTLASNGERWAIYNSSTGAMSSKAASTALQTLYFTNTNLDTASYYYLAVTGEASSDNPGINLGSMSTATNVVVTATFGGGVSASSTLIDFQNYYSVPASSTGYLNATADVNNSRLKFTTALTTTSGAIRVAKQSSYGYVYGTVTSGSDIAIADRMDTCVDNVMYTLSTTDTSAITSVSMGGTVRTYGTTTSGAWVSSDSAVGDGATGGTDAADNITEAVVVSVTGTDIINTRNWTTTVSDDATSGFTDITYATAKSWGSWGVNGYQGIAPYLSANSNNYTVCKFFNGSTSSADVFVDVYPSDGTTAVTGTSLGSIAAGATGSYYGDTIASTAGVTAETYAARFTVAVTADNVAGTCIMRGGNGQRVIPLYQDTGSYQQY